MGEESPDSYDTTGEIPGHGQVTRYLNIMLQTHVSGVLRIRRRKKTMVGVNLCKKSCFMILDFVCISL
jgi:hypothetical protein